MSARMRRDHREGREIRQGSLGRGCGPARRPPHGERTGETPILRRIVMVTREQFFEVFGIVRTAVARNWRIGAAVSLGMVGAAVVGTMLMPRSYYSEARLFVRFGRENQVDPTASGGQMVSLYESRESEINSLIEILKSRAILDRVVGELGPACVLHGWQAQPEQHE